jgi:hypothetical protein
MTQTPHPPLQKEKNCKECFNFILGLAIKVGSRQMGDGLKVSLSKGSTQTHSPSQWECKKNTSYCIPTKLKIWNLKMLCNFRTKFEKSDLVQIMPSINHWKSLRN